MTQDRNHQNVTLIGMPAAGKSTLGVLLAKRLGYGFVDTDLVLQTEHKMQLQEIIRQRGVEGFCKAESDAVQQLAVHHMVIATGGSVVYSEAAMAHLHKVSRIIFLDIDLAPLLERLQSLDRRGVVHMPGQTIDQIYAERRPLYQQYAQITIQCTAKSPEQIVRNILDALASHH